MNTEVAAKRLTSLKGLRDLRRAAGVSQETLGRYAGVSTMSIRRFEAGARVPPLHIAGKMARTLGQRGVTEASTAGIVMASARDVAATKTAEAAHGAIDALAAMKVDARPDAETVALIDMLIATLAELRGQAYERGGFSGDGNGLAVDITVDDQRPDTLGLGGRPQTTTTEFGVTALSRDGLGRSRSATKSAPARDGLGRARPAAEPVERDGLGRRRKGA